MEKISVKYIETIGRDHEAVTAHPKAVREGGRGEGDYENRREGWDEDDEGFGGEQVEEEPHYPAHEIDTMGVEVGEPVCDYGVDKGNED